jgi:histone-lysine N-methyltransferase SETMAR
VTGDEKWFPFFQQASKRQNMAWVGSDDPRPTALRPGFRSKKRMLTIFFDFSGPLVDVMPQKCTMTGAYYAEVVLPQLSAALEERRPQRLSNSRIAVLHDNASSHGTLQVRTVLQQNKLSVISHPPYSPDLSPCDFWLFPLLTERLAGQNFARVQDLAKAVNSELRSIPSSEFAAAFQKWIHRLERCV